MSIKKQMQKANSNITPGLFIYAGGFAPLGGIEAFLADLSQAVANAGVRVELLAWDRRSKLLQVMRKAGVRTYCSPWRWGNR
jgi:hypothetical protein